MKIGAQGLGKRFRKGERLTSLRDTVWTAVSGTRRPPPRDRSEFWALRNVSFRLDRGECLGVIGVNGAGKSTLLKLISAILRADQGTLDVRGRVTPLIEAGAGFHPDLTGMENILLNAAILGCSLRKARAAIDDIVAFAELEAFIHTPVKRYSSGMYRRLGFSVAAHLDPDILLIDELLSVGDYLFADRCLQRMASLRDRGVTMLFVSHNLHQVRLFCDSALWLDHGEPAAYGAVDEVIGHYLEAGEFEAARLDIGGEAAPVRFVDAAVLGADGAPAEHIDLDGVLTVELEIEAPEVLAGVGVVLAIETIHGTPVFGASTFLDRGPMKIPAGRHRLRCHFPRVPLMPGPYQVRAAIVDEAMSASVVPWQAVGHLAVRGGAESIGYRTDHVPREARSPYPCHVEHAWRWLETGGTEPAHRG
jgi:lipopolysaccharide transport system ATP-binding protein